MGASVLDFEFGVFGLSYDRSEGARSVGLWEDPEVHVETPVRGDKSVSFYPRRELAHFFHNTPNEILELPVRIKTCDLKHERAIRRPRGHKLDARRQRTGVLKRRS